MLRERIFITKVKNSHPSRVFHRVEDAFEYFKLNGYTDETKEYIIIWSCCEWELHELKPI